MKLIFITVSSLVLTHAFGNDIEQNIFRLLKTHKNKNEYKERLRTLIKESGLEANFLTSSTSKQIKMLKESQNLTPQEATQIVQSINEEFLKIEQNNGDQLLDHTTIGQSIKNKTDWLMKDIHNKIKITEKNVQEYDKLLKKGKKGDLKSEVNFKNLLKMQSDLYLNQKPKIDLLTDNLIKNEGKIIKKIKEHTLSFLNDKDDELIKEIKALSTLNKGIEKNLKNINDISKRAREMEVSIEAMKIVMIREIKKSNIALDNKINKLASKTAQIFSQISSCERSCSAAYDLGALNGFKLAPSIHEVNEGLDKVEFKNKFGPKNYTNDHIYKSNSQ